MLGYLALEPESPTPTKILVLDLCTPVTSTRLRYIGVGLGTLVLVPGSLMTMLRYPAFEPESPMPMEVMPKTPVPMLRSTKAKPKTGVVVMGTLAAKPEYPAPLLKLLALELCSSTTGPKSTKAWLRPLETRP